MSAVKNANIGSPYRVPPEPSRWPAIALAVGVHALLLAFLMIGISWQNNQPEAVEAEVWDMKVQTAAPPPAPVVQETEPEPQPEPESAPKVVQQPEPPEPAPDIRLEREKQRKEQLRREQEERERELAEQKAREEAKLAEKKAKEEALKKEQARKEAERKEKELAEKKAEEDAAKKQKAEKLAKAKADAANKAKLEADRKQELQRMMAQAGNGTNGTAAKSTAPRMDSGYLAAITAKIKSATHYAGSTDEPGNPTVSFTVEQLPNGEILSVKLAKSSGIPAFDEAVKRGIENATPLPKKKDGTVERSLEVYFHMKDLK